MTNASDIITTYEGRDGYALVDKAQFEWLQQEVERLKEQLRISNKDFTTVTVALVDAVAASNAEMARLNAENARLKQELEDYQRDGDYYWLAKPASQ